MEVHHRITISSTCVYPVVYLVQLRSHYLVSTRHANYASQSACRQLVLPIGCFLTRNSSKTHLYTCIYKLLHANSHLSACKTSTCWHPTRALLQHRIELRSNYMYIAPCTNALCSKVAQWAALTTNFGLVRQLGQHQKSHST